MTVLRNLSWFVLAVVAGLAAALGGFFWVEQPLWVGEYTGAKNSFAITSDGGTLIGFERIAQGPDGKSGQRVSRRQARSGRLLGMSFIPVDPVLLEHTFGQLLDDNLIWLETKRPGDIAPTRLIYEVVNGNRYLGPVSGSEIGKSTVDPHGRWRVHSRRDRVEVESLPEGRMLFEVSRPRHFVQDALVHRDGERLLVCWYSGETQTGVIETWDVVKQQRRNEANVNRFEPLAGGELIGERLHFNYGGQTHVSYSLSDDDFGAERNETQRERELGRIKLVRPQPGYIVATRNATLAKWQEVVNPWISKVGLPPFVRRSEFAVVVLDARTGWKIGEMPQTGTGYFLSADGKLLAAYDTSGRIVVWDVRRAPERWGMVCGLTAAMSVLLLGYWRLRRNRLAAAHRQPAAAFESETSTDTTATS